MIPHLSFMSLNVVNRIKCPKIDIGRMSVQSQFIDISTFVLLVVTII